MRIKEVVSALERFAPLPLQDGYDNAGLQIGLTEAEATGALLCLDVTEAVIDEAIALGYNLVIAHHPLLFKGYKSITGRDYVERCILKAIKNDVAVYAIHTNLDNVMQGVNHKIAQKLGLVRPRILAPQKDCLLKLLTYVPTEQAERVRQSLFDAGCGVIGNYDSCSYNLNGEGTFRALEGSTPFCGSVGELHREPETLVSVVLPAYKQTEAVHALLAAHPYEEPAYDLIPLKNNWDRVGAGMVAELETAVDEETFLHRVKDVFGVGRLCHTRLRGAKVKRVAFCGGAGSFLIPRAVAVRADIFLTGEIKYHDYFGYEDRLVLAAMGHYESERYTPELLQEMLRATRPELKTRISEINTNPITYL